jgi:hypothetical protein
LSNILFAGFAAEERSVAEEGATDVAYLRLAQCLQQIQCGEFPLGSLLPTEVQLELHYGVSRQTVRQAIGQHPRAAAASGGSRLSALKASSSNRPSVGDRDDVTADLTELKAGQQRS